MSKNNSIHGLSITKVFTVWIQMKQRCFNKNHPHYPSIGGAGIKIQETWVDDPVRFAMDMGFPPEGAMLRRKDTSGDYTKENCFWGKIVKVKGIPFKPRIKNEGQVSRSEGQTLQG